MAKNIVMCFDGTNNQVRVGRDTNVLRLYKTLDLDDPSAQVAYYDTGVGTFHSPGAWTPVARKASRLLGLAVGAGLRQNLGEAYTYLMQVYEPDDCLYLFGFSRGAFTARGLAGMLEVYGLFRRGAENMVPYAVNAYAKKQGVASRDAYAPDGEGAARARTARPLRRVRAGRDDHIFAEIREYVRAFTRPATGRRDDHMPVHFLGAWDTVKATRTLGSDMAWPYTAELPHVHIIRHALSLDEWRRPYAPYHVRTEPHHVPLDQSLGDVEQDRQDVWFAGVHSDVGGGLGKPHRNADECPEPKALLSTIALKWMLNEAAEAGLHLRPVRYKDAQKVARETASLESSKMKSIWWVLGRAQRQVPQAALVHASVAERCAADLKYSDARIATATIVDHEWHKPRALPKRRAVQPCCSTTPTTPVGADDRIRQVASG